MQTIDELAASEPQDRLAQLAANEPPPPAAPQPNLLQRYVSAMGRSGTGAKVGGTIGGIAGGAVGSMTGPAAPFVAPALTAIGGALGNAAGQRIVTSADLSPEQQQQLARHKLPPDYIPPKPPPVDWEAATADGATQGAFSGLLRLAGAGAARLGFPRVAGVLGARPPAEAVAATTPQAVKGISTPALQAVDAATLAGNPAAKEIAAISAEQARRDAVLALERQTAERNIAPIQGRMAQRVPGLAAKSKNFSDEIVKAVPPDKVDAAFADAPSVREAAIDPNVMGARQQMIQEAVPQTVDNQALKLARRPVAAAEARGVSGPPTQAAADAAGLRELGGNMPADNSYLTRVVNRVPGVGSAMQILPEGGLSPDRVAQTTAAVLASRGQQTINPELAKMLAGGAVYRASPVAQADAELLRRFLDQKR